MFSVEEILKITQGELLNKDFKNFTSKIKNIFIDSRQLKPFDAFIAIKGENFDGHNFLNEAIKKQARILILSKKNNLKKSDYFTNKTAIIKVKNTLLALHKIAACYRQRFDIPIIGITGSCGKTTTKDMIASILSEELKTLKTKENLNNEIGVPLTLLKLRPYHKAAVIEMGMQKQGEIKPLALIAKPSIAVITNVGEAHIKYLKTRSNIAKSKSEIFSFLKKGAYAILPEDDEYGSFLKNCVPKDARIKTFGEKDIPKYNHLLKHKKLYGIYNIHNAICAIKTAKILQIKDISIIKGLKKFKPSSKRMEFIKRPDGITIINDTYNASPSSMRATLTMFSEYPAKRKIAVLGDMLELGRFSYKFHREIGNLIKKLGLDIIITIGPLSKTISKKHNFTSNKKAINFIKKQIKNGDAVFIKGSRGMKLDQVVDALRL